MLLEVYQESFRLGILPHNMRVGLITLLEKKGKDRLNIANWRPITLLGIDYKLLTKTLGERLKLILPSLIHKDQNGFVPGGNIFFSTHTIRDLIFYSKKENLPIIMLCLDYTQALDSVNFIFIHKTFELFNFGEQFRKWLKVIYNEGESCISNNGYVSESFKIKRSTRQGDPISPLVFILCLEVLLSYIRSDPNIKGIEVRGGEIKITSFADDATYFMKDDLSAQHLLEIIEQFSKISGLEVNQSKSECLLLQFETQLGTYQDNFHGIPVVDNVKVLGHYFGKNATICEFQNFYSKIPKIERIFDMWKQRHLPLF